MSANKWHVRAPHSIIFRLIPKTKQIKDFFIRIERTCCMPHTWRESRASSSRFGDANQYDNFSRFGDSGRYDNRYARNFSRSQGSGRDTPRCQIFQQTIQP